MTRSQFKLLMRDGSVVAAGLLIAATLGGWLLPATIGGSRTAMASEVTVIGQRMLNAKSAAEATSGISGPLANCRNVAVYVDWGTGVASGVVKIETAVDAAYTGTWATLTNGTITFAGTAPNQQVLQFSGPLWALRTRISTVVAGGTVSTWVICN